LIGCVWKSNPYKAIIDDNSLSSVYLSLNIKYGNEQSRIAITSFGLFLADGDTCSWKEHKKKWYQALKNGKALEVDSITFVALKQYVVTPQKKIDSLYKGDVNKLLSSSIFNERRALLSSENSLTDEEQRYVIDILFRNNIFIRVDDETGYLFIENIK
jgi:hypothetical protein